MPQQDHLEIPEADLPEFLQGLEPPVTVDEVLGHAEAHGASPEALDFIESLPAAVFTTAEGMRHAFSTLQDGHVPPSDPENVAISRDGTSS